MGVCASTGNHGLGIDGNGKMDISGIKEEVQSSHMNQAAARKIKELVVTDNNLASFPPSVGKVLTLTSLNCSVNQLEELPNELLLLVNLTCLDASDNKLKKLPDEIGNCLLKLETLHLYKNLISTLPGKIIGIPSHGILSTSCTNEKSCLVASVTRVLLFATTLCASRFHSQFGFPKERGASKRRINESTQDTFVTNF